MRLGWCLPVNNASVIWGDMFAHCKIRLMYRRVRPELRASSPIDLTSSATNRSYQPRARAIAFTNEGTRSFSKHQSPSGKITRSSLPRCIT